MKHPETPAFLGVQGGGFGMSWKPVLCLVLLFWLCSVADPAQEGGRLGPLIEIIP